ncbi:MmcQ/YjbR family DNA-binding protein [Curtobacterium sp. MCPF17_046]|uniref:MmcQ/YjbR family DNA-binding protein n=1 Tax=Curtobacterium sp. MCPF17_046 TaxID=2175663 RepID=UPI001C645129|nr:MmcQ/YjbR family DNA-binding protein [Curtobacterium sp. MCPF17_046]
MQQIARDTAAALPHVSEGRPFTPHLDVWKVRDKVFLIVTEDDPELQIITVKVDPHHADALRRDHDTITPGRYLDKQHWVSVASGPGVTKRLVEDLVHGSYDLAAGHRNEQGT